MSQRNKKPEADVLRDIEEAALADVVSFIKNAISICYESKSVPVFTQLSLTNLYNEKLLFHGASIEHTKKKLIAPIYGRKFWHVFLACVSQPIIGKGLL